ncbi:hypothetical protein CMO91_04040 [Candidatus Woesearchaeota archaeon]|nr:hypothetical protein [Candidatus Woesearchaeota archaeon]|tara:strand:+ start:1655 stop:2551 length:897 start_codon:yes stop_codon:yes gene_type:complete
MVFVRKIKGYYVLAHSVREGAKVVQKTRYLGKNLPSKQQLEILKRTFLQDMRSPKNIYLSQEDLAKIEEKKKRYECELKRLTGLERTKRFEQFMIRYTYDSSKLSGVDVTLRQTYLILKDGRIPKGFTNLKTAKELENHERGVVAITKYEGTLTIAFMKKLHKILFIGVEDEIAGKTRDELKRNVRIGGTTYVPPRWNVLAKELNTFFGWYKTENRKLHPLELAALVHIKIISLQPFADGNSRLARLLMNWILWKKKYPLIDIPAEDLEKYYDVLDTYQIEKNENPFVRYIVRKFLSA